MNASAKAHLAKAKEYADRGEQFYRMAAEQIIAAQTADSTLGQREIAAWFDRSQRWVGELVRWHTSADDRPTPFSGDTALNLSSRQAAAKRVLRESPAEQIAEMLVEPGIRAKLSEAHEIAQRAVRERSRQAETEALGEDISAALDQQQTLRDAEAELFKARRSVIETLRLLNEAGDALSDSWREEFLRTFDDIAAKLDLGRGLLLGSLDDELASLLTEEAR